MKRPENLIYGVEERPPPVKLALLALQQVALVSIYLVMLVIVVREAGVPPEAARRVLSFGMIAMGIGAVLQALWKGPVGSGYLAPPVLSAMYLQVSVTAAHVGGLPLVAGMTMLAGTFEAILSRFLLRLRQVFPPVVSGIIIIAVGFEVGLIGLKHLLCVTGATCAADLVRHFLVSLLTLGIMVGLSIWGRGAWRLFVALLGLGLGMAGAVAAGLITPEGQAQLAAAPLFALPGLGHLSYDFQLPLLVPFLLAGLAAGLRTIGVVTTCQQINDADWQKPEIRSIMGGVLADGLSSVVSGALGATGLSTSPSAVGASQASGATSRYVALAVGVWFAVLACFPKLMAVFLAFPDAVLGGALVFSGSILLAGGMRLAAAGSQDTRKTFIIGISILLGLSHKIFPEYFQGLPHWLQLVTSSMLSTATIAAVALNLLFRLGIRRTASISVALDEDSGEKVGSFVRLQGMNWGAGNYALDRVLAASQDVLTRLRTRHLADGPLTVQVSYDQIDLMVEIAYRGEVLPQKDIVLPPGGDDLNGMLPLAPGLDGSWRCLCPDPVTCKARGADCRIRLVF